MLENNTIDNINLIKVNDNNVYMNNIIITNNNITLSTLIYIDNSRFTNFKDFNVKIICWNVLKRNVS